MNLSSYQVCRTIVLHLPPRDQLIHDNHPPSYNRNLPWIYVADFWLHSLHKHLTAATAPILFLINRSSAALSCRTNNSPRSSGDISSAQGAFSPSLLSRRTTTLGGDGDPEIIDKFSSPTKKSHQSWKGTVALENGKCPLV